MWESSAQPTHQKKADVSGKKNHQPRVSENPFPVGTPCLIQVSKGTKLRTQPQPESCRREGGRCGNIAPTERQVTRVLNDSTAGRELAFHTADTAVQSPTSHRVPTKHCQEWFLEESLGIARCSSKYNNNNKAERKPKEQVDQLAGSETKGSESLLQKRLNSTWVSGQSHSPLGVADSLWSFLVLLCSALWNSKGPAVSSVLAMGSNLK